MISSEAEIHVGDVGTEFAFVFKDENGNAVDISTHDALTATFRDPTGDRVTVDLNVTDGPNGLASYFTVEDDLAEPGNWAVQGYVEVDVNNKFHTNIERFKVHPNL